MNKQVVMDMGDFVKIENTHKKLDRVLYLFECAYEYVENECAIKKFDLAFEEFEKCIKELGDAIE